MHGLAIKVFKVAVFTNFESVLTSCVTCCLQHSKRDLAVVALESLIKTSTNTEQVFTATRCLLRIKLTIMDTAQNKL